MSGRWVTKSSTQWLNTPAASTTAPRPYRVAAQNAAANTADHASDVARLCDHGKSCRSSGRNGLLLGLDAHALDARDQEDRPEQVEDSGAAISTPSDARGAARFDANPTAKWPDEHGRRLNPFDDDEHAKRHPAHQRRGTCASNRVQQRPQRPGQERPVRGSRPTPES
jgi:hypothetical protein